MKNLIKSIAGIISVLFSIQPLASWAAKAEKSDSKVSIGSTTTMRGPGGVSAPLCGSCSG